MKAPTSQLRFKNASSLLDYGFTNFEYKKLVSKNDTIKSVKVGKGISPSINAIANNDCGTIIAKGQDVNIEQSITLPSSLSAPIAKDEVIGKITYTLNGEIVSECELASDTSVDKINIISMNKLVLKNWFTVLRK